jgi:hypothetical protein
VLLLRGPCRGVIFKTFGATMQLRVLDWGAEISHGKFVVEEELKVGL